MAYEPYVDESYYKTEYKGDIPEDVLKKALKKASRHIDTLTYNRIVGKGFGNLTEFQQDIIRGVCCEQAEFEYQNADMIDSVLQSYGINGVSMTFGEGWNMVCMNGVAMKRDTYELLSQTGLCTARIGAL